ncbi:hypothetical protein ACN6MY_03620 [Peribacillus sp. B-H-3]|uniref:hypothetical protein n=1 Tax=Peribacillus sp. B-H-3 TaxID=3400420 RepID=UPI003B01E34E
MSEVTVWYMTEDERLAYIEKHPIVKTEKPKGKRDLAFANINNRYEWGNRKKA